MNSRDMTPYRATPLGSTYNFFVVARSEDEAVRMVRFSVPCIATVMECEPAGHAAVPQGSVISSDGRSFAVVESPPETQLAFRLRP